MKIIVQQAGVSFSGLVTGQILRFFLNLVIARLLGADELGVYALALSFAQIAEVIAIAGLDGGVLRTVNLSPLDPERQRRAALSALSYSMRFSFIASLLLASAAGLLSSMFNGSVLLQLTIICYAISVPLHVFIAVAGHVMQAYRELRPKIIASQIIVPGGLLLLTLSLWAAGGGALAILLPMPIAAFAAAIWIFRDMKARTGLCIADIVRAGSNRSMLYYSFPLMLVALTGMASHWLDILMLGWYSDARTVGIYQPAVRTAGLLRSVYLAFAGIAAPLFASLSAAGQAVELERLLRVVTRWIVVAALPPAVVLMVMPSEVLDLFGAGFSGAEPVLVLLSAAVLFQASTGLYDTLLQMSGFTRLSALNSLLALAIHFFLNMLLIPRYGISGAAFAVIIVYFLLTALRAVEVWLKLGMHLFSFQLFKPVAASGVTAVTLIVLRPFFAGFPAYADLAVAALVAFGLYAALIWMMKLEHEDLEIIADMFPFLKKQS